MFIYIDQFLITSKCAKHLSIFPPHIILLLSLFVLFFVSFSLVFFVCVCVCVTGQIQLGTGRKISVVSVPSADRWQDVVLGRMKWATVTIDKKVRSETHDTKTCAFSSGYSSGRNKLLTTFLQLVDIQNSYNEKHDSPALSLVPSKNKYMGL